MRADAARESKRVALEVHIPSGGSEALKGHAAEFVGAPGEGGQRAVKQEEVLERSAAGLSTCASSVEPGAREDEGEGRRKVHVDTAACPKAAVAAGSAFVPSEEALHAELHTFELLAQLRAVARRWALHQDNFFFHWNCLRSDWKARGAGSFVLLKPEDLKTHVQPITGGKPPGNADPLAVQERPDGGRDLVDTLW